MINDGLWYLMIDVMIELILEPIFWALSDTCIPRVWVCNLGLLMSIWCMIIVSLWTLIACLLVEMLVDICWLLEWLFDHTLRHMLRHLWVVGFMIFRLFSPIFRRLLNIPLVWYNACLFGWPLCDLFVSLGNALVQPFRIYYSLLFLVKISWGGAPLLFVIDHSMLLYLWLQLSFAHDVCLPTLWSFLKHTLCNDLLMFGWITLLT